MISKVKMIVSTDWTLTASMMFLLGSERKKKKKQAMSAIKILRAV